MKPHPGRGWILRALSRIAHKPFVAALPSGVRLEIRLGDPLSERIYCDGVWEPATTAALTALLRPGDLYVDVGANLGYFTTLASRAVGPQGRCLAIEPVPATRAWLERNLALNACANVEVVAAALGAAPGTTAIHVFAHQTAGTASQFRDGREVGETVQVAVARLDDLLAAEAAPPGVLKMDVEGAELGVIAGAERWLAASRPLLIFELNPGLGRAAGWSAAELLAALRRTGGYEFLLVGDQTLRPLVEAVDVPAPGCGRDVYIEILAWCPTVAWHVERLRAAHALLPEAP